jgi:hypothetical protein
MLFALIALHANILLFRHFLRSHVIQWEGQYITEGGPHQYSTLICYAHPCAPSLVAMLPAWPYCCLSGMVSTRPLTPLHTSHLTNNETHKPPEPVHALGLVRQVALGVAHICVKWIWLSLNLAYKYGGRHPPPHLAINDGYT